ncbi:hypothetical protein I6L76_16995 [Lelliottia amnigena]|nr:hypothetical protein [Lelliottia amnigena]QXB24006.1 hypothetical protein I6L76_16995 [Lelliottia amnigena]
MKKFLFILLALAMIPVALLIIITPMDSQKQYIFGFISIGLLFLMGFREGANKQVISSQADSLIKISRIWADFFPANTSNQPI